MYRIIPNWFRFVVFIREEIQKIIDATTRLLSLDPNTIDGKLDEISQQFFDLVEKPVRQGIDDIFVSSIKYVFFLFYRFIILFGEIHCGNGLPRLIPCYL